MLWPAPLYANESVLFYICKCERILYLKIIRSMPTPSRAIFVWRPYGSLLVVGPSFSFGTARAR